MRRIRTKVTGRPRKEINWDILNTALQYGGSLVDLSELLDMSEDTIQRRIKEEYDMGFSEYRNKKMGRVRMKLRQKQYEEAMRGNTTLLIWLGKQWLGQTDKQENKIETEVKIEVTEKDLGL